MGQWLVIYVRLLLLLATRRICRLLVWHGELREVALYVFLEQLSAELEVLERVIVGEQGVQVGDEVLAIELHHIVVEVDLRQDLQIGVQV